MISLQSLETMDRLLVVAEIAEFFAVSIKTVYQWVELEQIPHFKINGAVRFNPKDISAWLEGCRKGPRLNYNRRAQTVVGAREGVKN